MTIKKINGKFYLLSDEGYILHSENTLDNMWKWCNENFAYSVSIGKIKEAWLPGKASKLNDYNISESYWQSNKCMI